MKKYLPLFTLFTSFNAIAGNPVFSVTPNLSGQTNLVDGQLGTYIYQITNNSANTLDKIGLVNLPKGVTTLSPTSASGSCQTVPASCQYCSLPLTLGSHKSCLIKLNVNSELANNQVSGGPQICYQYNRPVYCSQPFSPEQINTTILPGPVDNCDANVANFNQELAQAFDNTADYDADWGPARASFPLSTANPNLSSCTSSLSWSQQRILAAAQLWINQKLNYCEHHVPDFATPVAKRGNVYGDGGYCSNAIDIKPNTPYYNQPVRWNYSGTSSETADNWINNQAMWYGFDCSNYTSFLYDFALNISFSSAVAAQAGQIDSTSSAGPNNGGAVTTPGVTSGPLVCTDGTTTCTVCEEGSKDCTAVSYISTIDSSGTYHPDGVTISELTNALQPGDLIYIAGALDERAHVPAVTHVIMWTGKTIGTGPGQVNPNKIAPNELCKQYWQPVNGQPVITDSHYQGPDYRMITDCFYVENIWAVRRPLADLVCSKGKNGVGC